MGIEDPRDAWAERQLLQWQREADTYRRSVRRLILLGRVYAIIVAVAVAFGVAAMSIALKGFR